MNNSLNSLNMLAASPATGNNKNNGDGSWFEAMADAWGKSLDAQASRIETKSMEVSDGNDHPSAITALTAESLKMSFLSSSSHTALSSVGNALETMARKS